MICSNLSLTRKIMYKIANLSNDDRDAIFPKYEFDFGVKICICITKKSPYFQCCNIKNIEMRNIMLCDY